MLIVSHKNKTFFRKRFISFNWKDGFIRGEIKIAHQLVHCPNGSKDRSWAVTRSFLLVSHRCTASQRLGQPPLLFQASSRRDGREVEQQGFELVPYGMPPLEDRGLACWATTLAPRTKLLNRKILKQKLLMWHSKLCHLWNHQHLMPECGFKFKLLGFQSNFLLLQMTQAPGPCLSTAKTRTELRVLTCTGPALAAQAIWRVNPEKSSFPSPLPPSFLPSRLLFFSIN